MLDLNDPRWPEFQAAYKIPIDLRPFLTALESEREQQVAWSKLWGEIHHQGDVGEGSFVAVPHLVRIHRARGVVDPNTYAMVTTIELARDRDENPDVPEWARAGYHEALVDLEGLAVQDIRQTTEPEAVQYILAFLALARGRREYARLLCDYSEAELVDFERQAT